MSHLRRIGTVALSLAVLGMTGGAAPAVGSGPRATRPPAAGVTTRSPTAAVARQLAAALARYGFPASEFRLAHTAVSVNPAGYAITTPIARNAVDQGNGEVIFARAHGQWRVIADGSSLTHVSGVPAAVLRALVRVPNEGSVPAP